MISRVRSWERDVRSAAWSPKLGWTQRFQQMTFQMRRWVRLGRKRRILSRSVVLESILWKRLPFMRSENKRMETRLHIRGLREVYVRNECLELEVSMTS